jgi:hypothetical protein
MTRSQGPSRGLFLILALAVSTTALGAGIAAADAARDARWREDLAFLAKSIREIHPDPFLQIPEADFQAEVQRIDAAIPDLDDTQVTVELMRLVALIRDGHSALIPASMKGFDVQYPVVIYPFDDGTYVAGANREYAAYVGKKVVGIGRLSTEDAFARIRPVINGENEFTLLDRIPRFLTYPQVLYALGIAEHPDRLTLTVEGADGSRESFTVTPVPEPDFTFVGPEVVSAGAVSARTAPTVPRHLQDLRKPFDFTYLEADSLVYVRFTQVRNAPDESFADFCGRLFAFVDSHPVDALALDIRYNHGGNNQLLKPLIHGAIRRNHGFNRPGHFYAVVGRGTFSAAISCTGWLEEHTDVRFVGEPTGSGPTHFGDADRIHLPQSGIEARISAWRWQTRLPWDSRPWFTPQVPAPPTFADYVQGRDPAMEAVARDRGEPSLEQLLTRTLAADGVDAMASAYRAYKETHPDRWTTTETRMNLLGYGFLGDGNMDAAIAVFQLNVESYPESPNCYDSLAEGYLNAGDRERAIALYRKALEVDPQFANAARMLARLEHGDDSTGN